MLYSVCPKKFHGLIRKNKEACRYLNTAHFPQNKLLLMYMMIVFHKDYTQILPRFSAQARTHFNFAQIDYLCHRKVKNINDNSLDGTSMNFHHLH